MSVENTETIDVIAVDNKTNKVVLTISDHLAWNSADHLMLLQEKLNSYLRFIESGELVDKYPKAKGRRVEINICFKYQMDDLGAEFLRRAAAIIEGAGIDFDFEVITE